MASYLGDDLVQGTKNYEQAVTRVRQLDDRVGFTSSLASQALSGAVPITNIMVSDASTLAELLPDVEMALKIAREIGQRPGEAYAFYQLGLCLSAQGEYRRALDILQQSLLIAEELEHQQWMITAHWARGRAGLTVPAGLSRGASVQRLLGPMGPTSQDTHRELKRISSRLHVRNAVG